jgi:hypothetical protein
MPASQLVAQTTYAELLERCRQAAFHQAFRENGTFVVKTVKGRRYWYFQLAGNRVQKYVGPETPELLEQIAHHKEAREDERERRTLASTLVRSFGLPRPIPEIGEIISGLADAGVFRLRSVLVGTVAYQTYSAMLGVRLPISALQTGDIAQFRTVSVAVEDQTPPVLGVLKKIDETFRPVPHLKDRKRVASYVAKGGLRVDFLTPNEGPERDELQTLPALQTDAQPLRFLDYLIYEPEPAAILHGSGVYVHVPAPERYAVHKLIVSRCRHEGAAKRDKDLQQAEALLEALAAKRPHELKLVWEEARNRGPRWRKLLEEGLAQIAPQIRDLLLKTVGGRRAAIPGIDLTFNNPPPHYDFGRDVVTFAGEALGTPVTAAISREALADYFGANGLGQEGRVQKFLENRTTIERMARVKYLLWPIEEPGAVLIKTADVPKLQKELPTAAPWFGNTARTALPACGASDDTFSRTPRGDALDSRAVQPSRMV